jgi:predicted RNA methylase
MAASPPEDRAAKRRATRWGLDDAGAAADFDAMRAAAAARRRGPAAAVRPQPAPQQRRAQPVRQRVQPRAATVNGSEEESAGSVWHVEMLNDRGRNEAYGRAVRQAVAAAAARTGIAVAPSVLEVGSGGAALLSLLAASAGAGAVVAAESDEQLASCAREVVAANGATASVQVVAAHSTNQPDKLASLLPAGGADVLLAELYDDRLLGERILPTMRHALGSLCSPCVAVVPARAAIYAVLVHSDTIRDMSALPALRSVVNSPITDPIEPTRLDVFPDLQFVSPPWEALSFRFDDPAQPQQGHRTVDVPVLGLDDGGGGADTGAQGSGARVDAVAFWWRSALWEGGGDGESGELTEAVWLSSADPDGHWTPCIWPLQQHEQLNGEGSVGKEQAGLDVPEGVTHVRVTAWHDSESLDFSAKLLTASSSSAVHEHCDEALQQQHADRASVVSDEEEEEEDEEEEETEAKPPPRPPPKRAPPRPQQRPPAPPAPPQKLGKKQIVDRPQAGQPEEEEDDDDDDDDDEQQQQRWRQQQRQQQKQEKQKQKQRRQAEEAAEGAEEGVKGGWPAWEQQDGTGQASSASACKMAAAEPPFEDPAPASYRGEALLKPTSPAATATTADRLAGSVASPSTEACGSSEAQAEAAGVEVLACRRWGRFWQYLVRDPATAAEPTWVAGSEVPQASLEAFLGRAA